MPAISRLVEDRYAVLSIPKCLECEAQRERGISVVTIATGKEVFLGEAGDLTFNLAADTVSYRTMATVEVQCSSDDYDGQMPNCKPGTTTKMVYQPTGAVKTAKLP